MLAQICSYIAANWVDWVFAAITFMMGYGYRQISKKLKAEETKNTALCEGVQALLRDRVVNTYNRALDKGYCAIYERESLERIYQAYHKLGGNDIATGLYKKIMKMSTREE